MTHLMVYIECMINHLYLLLSLGLSASLLCFAGEKVFYGNDDRQEFYQSSDQLLKELSLSTAAQIPNELLRKNGDNWTLSGSTLKETGVCASERFSAQLTSADCTGFLVASDVLITAGHCVKDISDCQKNYWVFDYANKVKEVSVFKFSSPQLYRCTAIIKHILETPAKKDFSIVKLDRAVEGRTPLTFRKEGIVDDQTILTVLGHPSGLPLKITSQAKIRSNMHPDFFVINADTFTGNSGSPVVDSQTGQVEGILVRGDTDYVQAEGKNCRIVKINQENNGRGEDVIRITIPAEFLK